MKNIIHFFIVFFICTPALLSQWEKCACSHNDNVMEFIRADSALYAITDTYVMRSDDNGITWENLTQNRFHQSITSIAYASDTLYLGTTKGMLCSGDKGKTWVESELNSSIIQSIITKGDTLFIYADSRFYRIVPGHLAEELLIADGAVLYDCTMYENTIFVGSVGCVYRSTDCGKSWVVKNNGLPEVNIERIVAKGLNVFALASDNIVYRSTNNGDDWTKVETNSHVPNLKIILTKEKCYITTIRGMLYSEDMGMTWQKYDTLESKNNYPVAVWEEESLTLFGLSYRGVFRSTDDGLTWLKTGAECRKLYDIDIIDTIIYGYEEGIYTSNDSAKTWSRINVDGRIYGNSHVLFTGEGYSNSFMRSYNKGKTWENISLPVISTYISHWLFKDSVFYVCTDSSVSVSNDYGNTWIKVLQGDTITNSIIYSKGIVSVQFSDGHVYYTTDKGKQWHSVKMQYSEKLMFFTIINGVYIASYGHGMKKSTNNGLTWEDFSYVYLDGKNAIEAEEGFLLISGERLLISDISGLDITVFKNFGEEVIDIARNGNDLYVCTVKGNIWKTSFPPYLTGVNEPLDSQTSTEINIYPNPATDEMTIHCINSALPITYTFTDILGTVITQGIIQEQTDKLTISTRNLPSGFYNVTFQMNGTRHTEKLSIVH